MKAFTVFFTHNEKLEVDAENVDEALRKAYAAADYQGVWDEVEIQEDCDYGMRKEWKERCRKI